MRISVLVVTWNSEAAIERCLESVRASRGADLCETLVWDNDSTDSTVAAVEAVAQGARVTRSTANIGFAAAMNRLAAQASGDALLLLNPDAYLEATAVRALVAALEESPTVAVVGGKLTFGDGRLQAACARKFPHPLELIWWLVSGRRPRAIVPDDRRPVDAVSGALMLVRRKFWNEVGGFDEGFPHGGEDLLLCLEAQRAGSMVVFEPAAVAEHELEASVRQASPEIDVLRLAGIVRFTEAAHGRGWGLALRMLLAARVAMVVILLRLGVLHLSDRRRRRASLLLAWAVRGSIPSLVELRRSGEEAS